LKPTTIQAYADDKIVFANSEENLQKQINRAKKFFHFANIILSPAKCEVMVINGSRNDGGIYIDGTLKYYMGKEEFIKYLGLPLGFHAWWTWNFMHNGRISCIQSESCCESTVF
jgi:hypothetical protein